MVSDLLSQKPRAQELQLGLNLGSGLVLGSKVRFRTSVRVKFSGAGGFRGPNRNRANTTREPQQHLVSKRSAVGARPIRRSDKLV